MGDRWPPDRGPAPGRTDAVTRYAPAPALAWVVANDYLPHDTSVYAMLVPDGRVSILAGTAAIIFLAAVDQVDPVAVIEEATGAPPEETAAEIAAFLAELVDRGFLVAAPVPGASGTHEAPGT